jgi:hypothetical protein
MPTQPEKSMGEIRFSSALVLAQALRIIAVTALVLGILGTVAAAINLTQETDFNGNHVNSGGAVVAWTLGALLGTVMVAGFFAFASYVLDILVETYSETWEMRMNTEPDDSETERQP